MTCLDNISAGKMFQRLDPRTRLGAAVWLALCFALVRRPAGLGAAMLCGFGLILAARLDIRQLGRRLLPINLFMLFVLGTLPWAWPGTPLLRVGPLQYTREGLIAAGRLAVRGNAILLVMFALVATLPVTDLVRALAAMRVPPALVVIFTLMVRYVEVIHHREYARLRRTMRVRCFQPGMNLHTYRSLGYMVGMLMVRSFCRAERVLEAMKCRGFSGRLPLAVSGGPGVGDIAFAAAAGAAGAAILAGGI
ncbi:MAG TPA: cobalt ECF transporter T component CbiQ [Kiritimatiellae bacterium]|nr:cobalt ECF transporter T component CbiQ [Kiritimatiellia bacterium]